VPGAVAARIINNGQSCIAAKRFIVHKACYDEFLRQFVHQFEELRVGNPLESSTDVGPIATRSGLEQLEQQVKSAIDAGARVACGGKRLPGPGFYYAPTVLADIPIDAAINREEVFGPVALVYRVDDIDAAIRLANNTPFGLASSVWTDDEAEQARFVQELEAGQTFINALVASDPRLPFGGVKRSGYGRELGSLGILEFVNSKTVYIRRTRT
jgi:succinate-semialdehyde dehydrogenase/glutarate-semialdehyde dehydrogenase